jgi:hypothetical protein
MTMLLRMKKGLIAGLCLEGTMDGAVAAEMQHTKIFAQLGHGLVKSVAFSPDKQNTGSGLLKSYDNKRPDPKL